MLLEIYNAVGQRIRTLVREIQMAGEHRMKWNGRGENGSDSPSGLYYCFSRAGTQQATHKMVHLK
jgi:flagellar hook assembly protein FlgD